MEGRTSEPSLKKPQESQMKPLQFLDLETINGILLESIMGRSFSIAWRVLDAQYWEFPNVAVESSLSQILQGHSAGEILLSAKGVSGDIEESRKNEGRSCRRYWSRH